MPETTQELTEQKTQAIVKSEPQEKRPSALQVMAQRCSVEPQKLFDTLKATVFKNASNEEMLAMVVVANEYRLNPFLKEIYAFPNKGGGIIPVVGVDGWIKLINSHPQFDGAEFSYQDDKEGKPFSCTCTLHIKGRSKPLSITEFYSECARGTDPWNKSPRRMLRHRALIQAARVAFGFSGIHDEDETAAVVEGRGFENAKPAKARTVIADDPAEPQAIETIAEVVP